MSYGAYKRDESKGRKRPGVVLIGTYATEIQARIVCHEPDVFTVDQDRQINGAFVIDLATGEVILP